MIIFGTRTKMLTGSNATTNCSHCGSQHSVTLSFALKYFHVFWIPMFPLTKVGISQCNHCKQLLRAEEMPNALKLVYQEEKAKVKTPLGYRFGSIIIGLFFVFVMCALLFGGVNSKYLKNPQVNDVYQMKHGYYDYALYRVVRVEGEMVIFVESKAIARSRSALDKQMKEMKNEYSTNELRFSKKELAENVDKDRLVDIDRPE